MSVGFQTVRNACWLTFRSMTPKVPDVCVFIASEPSRMSWYGTLLSSNICILFDTITCIHWMSPLWAVISTQTMASHEEICSTPHSGVRVHLYGYVCTVHGIHVGVGSSPGSTSIMTGRIYVFKPFLNHHVISTVAFRATTNASHTHRSAFSW
jgi:hypothetical protein